MVVIYNLEMVVQQMFFLVIAIISLGHLVQKQILILMYMETTHILYGLTTLIG